ncbi:MAG: hypothetical protein JSS87_02975 [Acidobacteria bacterium]|nr:hypothetical protein [Acidobacteriota bacterium]
MAHGEQSQRIRQRFVEKYLEPARRNRRREFSVRVGDLMKDMEEVGLLRKGLQHQVCTAIQKKAFLRENNLEANIEAPPTAPSGKSTTVTVHYRFHSPQADSTESAQEKADRLLKPFIGAMKKEIAARGGTEGYIRWVRGYDEDSE